MDILLDRAQDFLPNKSAANEQQQQQRAVVDLGSGCGRLALYMALSRPAWNVHGIEISPTFHQEAAQSVSRGVAGGWLELVREPNDLLSLPETEIDSSLLSLHLGPAAEYANLLRQADVIFCYSTAFEACGFSQSSAALILGPEWNELLTTNCHEQAICITTDKALDPTTGWTILDRIDVPNREVVESTGYIQKLKR